MPGEEIGGFLEISDEVENRKRDGPEPIFKEGDLVVFVPEENKPAAEARVVRWIDKKHIRIASSAFMGERVVSPKDLMYPSDFVNRDDLNKEDIEITQMDKKGGESGQTLRGKNEDN